MKLPNLKMLTLVGIFTLSPTIFSLDDKGENFSESLKCLRIRLSKVTPTGDWYFTGEPPLGMTSSEQEDLDLDVYFRDGPAPATFEPFLAAIARGIPKMPSLDIFTCTFHDAAFISRNAFPGNRGWTFEFQVEREGDSFDSWSPPSEFRMFMATNIR
ncbi:uncharacterized protein GGS22DRAFT_74940 [Annulohypoxylon maeteangense]|uniref:uncharacterized protein n=1 Tax=Annulohypoxylon maeteangense TaxID=1927788 RepID=UPI0020084E8F|nr:uncharacterized protein GGS22DRAFT_74940 [Annulohypoxylon maeteangense]KAI0881046.1 hypothetical protein GGS22DRAFT_74940 [Annulohypoxylon maeteangense]